MSRLVLVIALWTTCSPECRLPGQSSAPAAPAPVAPVPASPPQPAEPAEPTGPPVWEVIPVEVADAAISADAQWLAVTTRDGEAFVFEASPPYRLSRELPRSSRRTTVLFGGDPPFLLTRSLDGATLFDPTTGAMVTEVEGYPMLQAALTVDGQTIVTAYDVHHTGRQGVHVFYRDGTHRHRLRAQKPGLIRSPTGSDVIVTEGVPGPRQPGFSVVDTATGRVRWRRTFSREGGHLAVTWSPDGRRVAWALNESRVHVANAEEGTEAATIELERGDLVEHIDWSPKADELSIIAGGELRYRPLADSRDRWRMSAYEWTRAYIGPQGRFVVVDTPRPEPGRAITVVDTASGGHCSVGGGRTTWVRWHPTESRLVGRIDDESGLWVVDLAALGGIASAQGGRCAGLDRGPAGG